MKCECVCVCVSDKCKCERVCVCVYVCIQLQAIGGTGLHRPLIIGTRFVAANVSSPSHSHSNSQS